MKKLAQLAAVVGLGLGVISAATAQDSSGPKSRAEVIAELNAARDSGELTAMVGEDSGSFYLSQKASSSTLSRRQVVADVLKARRVGDLDWMYGEDSGSFVLSRMPAAAGFRYAGPNPGDSADGALARTAGMK